MDNYGIDQMMNIEENFRKKMRKMRKKRRQ